jgi:hypothetical protein
MSALVADREEIARFAEALFKHADPGGFVSLRAFFDKGEPREGPAYWPFDTVMLTPGALAPLIDAAAERATRCARHPSRVVFAPPIATFRNTANASADNLAATFAISVECDVRPQEAVASLSEIIGPPTIVVASGGLWTDPATGEVVDKLHAHWRLTKAATTADGHAAVKLARELACAIARSDPTSNSLVHPMRWPGSWHRKVDPRPARIERFNDAEVCIDDALAKLTAIALERGLAEYSDDQEPAGDNEKTAPIEKVTVWMSGIPNPRPDIDPNDTEATFKHWNTVGMALWAATSGSAEGLALFQEWSAKFARYDTREYRAKVKARWSHYFRHPPRKGPRGLGAGTLRYLFDEFWCDDTGNDAGDAHYDNP